MTDRGDCRDGGQGTGRDRLRIPGGRGWSPVLAMIVVAAAATCPAAEPPPSFANDVVPVLTKAGCNSGPCHAKANSGQNGFRLSLLGFEPGEDFEHIAKEARGRRISLAAPDESLLLRKASAAVPHGGGRRLAADSPGYDVLRRWIAAGAPPTAPHEPTLLSLTVEPARATVGADTTRALAAVARYSDGSVRNVTDRALYESNDRGRLEVDEGGVVRTDRVAGTAAVMVRYQGQVAVATFTVPQGATVGAMPAEHNFIDRLVFARLREVGVPPSPACDDATFHRRVSLDITGSIPTADAAAAFLASAAPDRRARVVDALLADSGYADFFANKWTSLLKNRRDDPSDTVSNFAFHSWIRDSLLANKPYDRLVRELLAATGTVVENPPVAWYKRVRDPKQQVEDVAQLFLGMRIQCAQCHHHPFERWSQDDYHGLSAYFAQVGRTPTTTRGEDLIFHKRGLAGVTNPRDGATLRPAALGRPEPPIPPDDDPRLRLADWMAAPDNPFFARALVNRYWKHFFGRGLVEPEDDLRDTNPATHPELLDALADHFRRSGFDLKDLVRTIVSSRAYQASAMPEAGNADDTQNFSHFQPRRLQAEVLLDAIDRVAGTTTPFASLPAGTKAVALPDNSYTRSSGFLKVFGRPDSQSVCECERVQSPSLGQSLHLLAAADIKAKLSAADGRAVRLAHSTAPEPEQIRELFLAAFAREPNADEVLQARAWLGEAKAGADGKPLPAEKARQEQYEDLLWALVNSKEFLFNH